MPAGFHKYPFNFSLPYNIPCSLEHLNGHIRYTTKAIIDRPWRFNHECKIAFTVVASYDLNAHSQQCVSKISMRKLYVCISFISILSNNNFAIKLQNDDTQNNMIYLWTICFSHKYIMYNIFLYVYGFLLARRRRRNE